MENPAQGGVSEECRSGKFDGSDDTRKSHDPQAAARAIGAGLICLPDACDMAFILSRRLDLSERIWLAISSLLSLPPDTAEELTEAVLHDLSAGPPTVWFWSLPDEAREWALFASRAELRAYMAACWQRLSEADRKGFLREVHKRERAA